MEQNCLTDKQGKKWVIDGYYFDGNQQWTLLIRLDNRNKRKKIRGII